MEIRGLLFDGIRGLEEKQYQEFFWTMRKTYTTYNFFDENTNLPGQDP